jgi:hypothetical protein
VNHLAFDTTSFTLLWNPPYDDPCHKFTDLLGFMDKHSCIVSEVLFDPERVEVRG